MAILAIFGLFVFIGDVIAIGICTIIEKYSQTWSLFAFLGMFMIVFVIAWPFWYIRRRYARERRPEIALEVLNQRYALGEIGRSEYLQNRDDILAAQVR